VGETRMNKQSSRSHCLFTLKVSSKRTLADGSTMECAGKLHMVDLAGSECAKTAGNGGGGLAEASRERERKNINQVRQAPSLVLHTVLLSCPLCFGGELMMLAAFAIAACPIPWGNASVSD